MTAAPKRWMHSGPAKGETWVSWLDRAPEHYTNPYNGAVPDLIPETAQIRAGYAALDERLKSGPIEFVHTCCGTIHSGRVYRTRSGRLTSPAPRIAHREMRGLRRCRAAVYAWLVEEALREAQDTEHEESTLPGMIASMRGAKLSPLDEMLLDRTLGLVEIEGEGQ